MSWFQKVVGTIADVKAEVDRLVGPSHMPEPIADAIKRMIDVSIPPSMTPGMTLELETRGHVGAGSQDVVTVSLRLVRIARPAEPAVATEASSPTSGNAIVEKAEPTPTPDPVPDPPAGTEDEPTPTPVPSDEPAGGEAAGEGATKA